MGHTNPAQKSWQQPFVALVVPRLEVHSVALGLLLQCRSRPRFCLFSRQSHRGVCVAANRSPTIASNERRRGGMIPGFPLLRCDSALSILRFALAARLFSNRVETMRTPTSDAFDEWDFHGFDDELSKSTIASGVVSPFPDRRHNNRNLHRKQKRRKAPKATNPGLGIGARKRASARRVDF